MRRLAAVFLLFALALPVQAAQERQYVALTLEDGPYGDATVFLLDGLYDRGIHATFLLQGQRMEANPEITRRIFQEGHEIGCNGYSGKTMTAMSRRQIAQEIMDTQALLPQGCQMHFFWPTGGTSSDAIRQVAEARKLAFLSWSADGKNVQAVQDGDILRLRADSVTAAAQTLAVIDALTKQGCRIVSVQELVKIRRAKITPGKTYTCFPPAAAG